MFEVQLHGSVCGDVGEKCDRAYEDAVDVGPGLTEETGGDYGADGAGMGSRESVGRIAGNLSQFVAHLIEG